MVLEDAPTYRNLFGTIERLSQSAPMPLSSDKPGPRPGVSTARSRMRWRFIRANPYLWSFAITAFAIFCLGTWHFRLAFHIDWLTAAYFVLATMTTTGYGDITPTTHLGSRLPCFRHHRRPCAAGGEKLNNFERIFRRGARWYGPSFVFVKAKPGRIQRGDAR